MGNFNNLKAWQEAMDLVVAVYTATARFPKSETFGLALQMRKAAVSIPSNIAEGEGRFTDKDHRRFLVDARGSTLELETQIKISQRVGFLHETAAVDLLERTRGIGRMINGLLRHLAASEG